MSIEDHINHFVKITPRPDCKACHGMGTVAGDSVPYGSTTARLPDDFCDCVVEQVAEDDDRDIEIELAPEVAASIERARDVEYVINYEHEDTYKPLPDHDADDYDYARDDQNFDADRERRYFRK